MLHHVRSRVLLAAVTLAPAGFAVAQPPRVLALTDTIPLLTQLDSLCTSTPCAPVIAPAFAPYAGGVAHDPRDRMTWISDGINIAKADPRTLGCTMACLPFPAPNLALGQVVTGLAFNEQTQQLFVSHSDNRIQTYLAVGCTLTFQSQCFLTVPANHKVSGLATDDVNNLLFYGTGPWGGFSTIPHDLEVTNQANPCLPICPPLRIIGSSGAPLAQITGLAFDSCASMLHATDGIEVVSTLFISCTALQPPMNICNPFLGQGMTGLCVLPWTETSSAITCFAGSMPVCSNMRHELRGDATLGNFGFALDLVNAPGGALAVLQANLGACSNTTNFGICDLVPPNNLWIQILAGAGCGGSGSMAFPLPAVTVLCGITVSTRWAGIMGNVANNFVSNCLTWTIGSS